MQITFKNCTNHLQLFIKANDYDYDYDIVINMSPLVVSTAETVKT